MKEPKIIAWGHYAPDNILTNFELEKNIDTNHEWIYERLGINERRVSTDEIASDLAVNASLEAISKSNLTVDDIDAIIIATATPDRLAPSTAAIVQGRLGCVNAACFDMNAVCSGGVYSITVASGLIRGGLFKNILVIGVDVFSKITDWNRRDAVFFGDGAGAIILSAQEKKHFLSANLHADGMGWDKFTIPGGAGENPISKLSLESGMRYFQMDGRAVFDTAIKVLPKTILKSISDAGIDKKEISRVIPHQPSINILKKVSELTDIPWHKWCTNMDRYANTSSATIFIMLSEACDKQNFNTNEIMLMAAVGSGWTYGSLIYKW